MTTNHMLQKYQPNLPPFSHCFECTLAHLTQSKAKPNEHGHKVRQNCWVQVILWVRLYLLYSLVTAENKENIIILNYLIK